jgi:hypothetical protein
MKRTLKQIITGSRVFKAVLIFLVSFVALSAVWLKTIGFYGYGVTLAASKFVAEMKDSDIEGMTREHDIVTAIFSHANAGRRMSVDVSVRVSSFAFNVPMVAAMLLSLYPFLKRKKRAYAEAIAILVLIHIFYVFSVGALQLTKTFMAKGMEPVNLIKLSVYQFVWGATEYATMSFAPFLIVIYTFVRFREQRRVSGIDYSQ